MNGGGFGISETGRGWLLKIRKILAELTKKFHLFQLFDNEFELVLCVLFKVAGNPLSMSLSYSYVVGLAILYTGPRSQPVIPPNLYSNILMNIIAWGPQVNTFKHLKTKRKLSKD